MKNIMWIVFAIIVPVALALDLLVFQRKAHEVKAKEALWHGRLCILGAAFGGVDLFYAGFAAAMTYFTGYIVEISLSMDNLFVFILIFTSFCVPAQYQHRVLFWGIIGAMVMRAVFILAGVAVLEALSWVIYIFGAFLVYTGIKIATKKEGEAEPKKNPVFKLARKYLPVAMITRAQNFFIKKTSSGWQRLFSWCYW